jgi:16S rRNA (cytosine967-C5)-methyltransferase
LSRKTTAWRGAIDLLIAFEEGTGHLDDLLERIDPNRSRWLVMAVFRDWLVIDSLLNPRMSRRPRPVAMNLLRLAVAECLQGGDADPPRVVHHAVETAREMRLSKAETGFINGVLRSLLRAGLPAEPPLAATHPDWLVRRWERRFGEGATRRLLEWNQGRPEYFIVAGSRPAYAEPSPWSGYYRVRASRFGEALADLEAGRVYVQDPFARIPVELLDPQPDESVMDLCAAPGGKSRRLSEQMGGTGQLVLVDRPGRRLDRLRGNAAGFPGTQPRIIGSPVEILAEQDAPGVLQPGSFDAVLIDVPCSNTGVIRKRPDVKLRIREGDIGQQARNQHLLLKAAGRWVRPGGRLVYSTCSLEAEENDGVVDAFLAADSRWRLRARQISLPWECGHDGGGAFLLTLGDEVETLGGDP